MLPINWRVRSESRVATRGLPEAKMPHQDGLRTHCHAGSMTESARDLALPGGTVMSRLLTPSVSSTSAARCEQIASRCHDQIKGVEGSNTDHARRKNVASDQERASSCAAVGRVCSRSMRCAWRINAVLPNRSPSSRIVQHLDD